MPETCGNWLGTANSSVHYAHKTPEIYQALPRTVDFKAHVKLEIHWVRQYLA